MGELRYIGQFSSGVRRLSNITPGGFKREKCDWDKGNGDFKVIDDFGAKAERRVIRIAISHVGDFLIMGPYDFIEFRAGKYKIHQK